ncbi:MAG: hypothetical protein ACXWCU_06595 [Caldimonas sp.]
MRRLAVWLGLVTLPAWAAAPAPGRYQATLCVAPSASAPPSCGPAELDVRSPSRAQVKVADVVYRLHLRPAQVDVATMHGRMQIDEFSAEYEWHGDVLSFVDAEKQARYEVKTGARLRPSP